MLKISRYTVAHEADDGVLLYNLKNGVQIFVNNDSEFKDDLLCLRNDKCDDIKNDILRNAFCIQDDIDEVQEVLASYYKRMFDPTNLSFIIMPNNGCNFSCKYCYQNHDHRHISEENICKFINAVKNYHIEQGLRNFYIEWFGGEPLLSFKTIKKVTDELNEYFHDKNNIRYHYGATTNGSLFTREQIEYMLKNHFDFFQITLDGGRKTHNNNRHAATGEETWDVIFNNLKVFNSFKEFDFRIDIRVNYNYDTFDGISELLDAIKENLDDRFTVFFHSIGKWGGESDEALDVIDYSLEPYLTLMLMEEAVKNGIKPLTNYNYYNPFKRVCYAGMPYHFTLGSDGKLRKCNEEDIELDKVNIVGTIENDRIELDLYKWSRFVLPDGKITLDYKCKECIYLPVCFAQNCPKTRIMNEANVCPNDFAITSEVLLNKYNYMLKTYKKEQDEEKS